MDILSENDLQNLSTADLKEHFNKAFNQVFSTTQYKFNPTYFYRGRPNWDGKLKKEVELFDNVRELWAPPQVPELKQGRCNGEGQSLFYCTNDCTATLWELDCQPGQKITIGIYQCIEDLNPLGIIGASKIATIGPEYNKIFGGHYHSLKPEAKELHDFVDRLFRQKGSSYYNATNAITSIFLNNNSSESLPAGLKSADAMQGLIYSSVAVQLNLYNLVLQPEYAKKILKPVEFNKYSILERPSENKLVIELTHSSKSIASSGDIEWVERDPHIIERITDIPV